METRVPVVLIVLVEAARLRWSVAAVRMDGAIAPLLRSEEGDLATYQGLDFDDQVSFLRHRFCGVVQRGCDRLWPVGQKACQFVFLFDELLPGAAAELTQRVAEHFAEWMLSPPVVVYVREGGFTDAGLRRLAGTIDRPIEDALRAGLAPLSTAMADSAAWEVSHRKGTWQPPSNG